MIRRIMSKFRVHVQHISYGWCGIDLFVNGKRIICNAGYMGPNPLASLIDVCLDFFVAKNKEEDEEMGNDEFDKNASITWEEEPGSMRLEFKLFKNDIVSMHIQERNDDEKVLEEWQENIPFGEFKDAIVNEGLRVLNAFGLYGYYVAWMDHVEFPLTKLLCLIDNTPLIWKGDYCSTNLSEEIQCLSRYIKKLEIKEETHYDECKIYYEAWQMQCCGDPFAVGDKVDWTCVIPKEYKNAHGIILDFEEEHHGFATYSICGTVTQIIVERSEFAKGKQIVDYQQAKTIHEEILKANGHEKDYKSDEETDRTFWGYIIILKDAVVKPLPEKI